MKIYTKTGDQGETCLIGGKKVKKWNKKLEAYGTVDELNSHIGALIQNITTELADKKPSAILEQLQFLQNTLFNVGSLLACSPDFDIKTLPQITSCHVEDLEKSIDDLTKDLAPLKNFILPGGSLSASTAHICRTICRRAERNTIEAFSDDENIKLCIIFLNRLSDYFFTLARHLNHLQKVKDILWDKD